MTRARWLVFVVGVALALAWGLTHRRAAPPRDAGWGSDATLPSASAHRDDGTIAREVSAMGTQFTIVADAPPSVAESALDQAVEALRALDEVVSSWRPGSDVSRINAAAGKAPVLVGADTLALLQRSIALHQATAGAFDVTIGAVWDVWPFRDATRALPTDDAISAALALVGADQIRIDVERSTALLPRAGMRLNLGAVGKGYAAARIADVLAAHGVTRSAVSAGGDLVLRGRKSTGPWRVAVEHPRRPEHAIERFDAGDVAVATSGDGKRRIVRDGRGYGHILDPRTGRPADGALSVTVLTADPVEADAFATAVFVMGPQRGMRWVEQRAGVEALIVDVRGVVHRSSKWYGAGRGRAGGRSAVSATGTRPQQPGPPKTMTPLTRPPIAGALRPVASPVVDEPPLAGGVALDRTEVTNADYGRFLAVAGHRFCHPDEPRGKDHTPRYWRPGPELLARRPAGRLAPWSREELRSPQRPVVGVDWWDAYAYARWAGKRLPTRSEWTLAACGRDGRRWPWGDVWDAGLANTGGERRGEHDGHLYVAPVGAYPGGVSPSGCLDMAGNAAEWTAQGWVMGGSSNSPPSGVTCRAGRVRESGYRAFTLGFRCASDEQEDG